MKTPPVIITGTGRSGTGYAAAVLTNAGLRAGHEQFFSIGAPRAADLHVECSWMALNRSFADSFVIHQRRDPVDIFASFLTKRWITDPREPYFAKKLEILPDNAFERRGLPDPPLPCDTNMTADRRCKAIVAAVHVLELGWIADSRSQHQIRLEYDWDPFMIQMIGDKAGQPIDFHTAVSALDATSRTTNHHGHGHPIPPSELHHWIPLELAEELHELRARWDYP